MESGRRQGGDEQLSSILGTSCSQVIVVSLLIIPQPCLEGARQVCPILSFSQQVDVTDNTVYDILPNLPSISHKRDILLLSADSCLLPQLVQNSWGQEESYLLFSFFITSSITQPFFFCILFVVLLLWDHKCNYLLENTWRHVLYKKMCSCLMSASSHRCHCVQENIYFLIQLVCHAFLQLFPCSCFTVSCLVHSTSLGHTLSSKFTLQQEVFLLHF